MTTSAEICHFQQILKTMDLNIFSYDYAKFTYLLAHLKNAKEYGLFNLHTGYQLHRNEIYIRKLGVGIMIPKEHLVGLILIKRGGGA